MAKLTDFSKNLLLLAFSLLFSLILLEVALIYLSRVQTYSEILKTKGEPYPVSYSDYLPFTLPGNITFHHQAREFDVEYKFNSFGYRGDAPATLEKPVNRKRILVIGDSFTLGWGVSLENSFVQQLQDSLGEEYEVINAAYHAGYAPDCYYAYLVREGAQLNPDIVLIVLYAGNDLLDMIVNQWTKIDERSAPEEISTVRLYINYKGELLRTPESLEPYLPWNYRVPVLRNSHAFIALTNFSINRIFKVKDLQSRLNDARIPIEEAWKRLSITSNSISAWCSARNCKLAFINIPLSKRNKEQYQDHRRLSEIIRNEVSRPLLDMDTLLPQEVYFEVDAHLNNAGNKIVSQLLLSFLKEQNLVATAQTERE